MDLEEALEEVWRDYRGRELSPQEQDLVIELERCSNMLFQLIARAQFLRWSVLAGLDSGVKKIAADSVRQAAGDVILDLHQFRRGSAEISKDSSDASGSSEVS